MHGGAAPQTIARAKERLLAAADPIAAELIRLARNAESESVRRQACSDILDRAGIPRQIGVEHTGKDGSDIALNVSYRELILSRINSSDASGGTPENS